MPKLRTLPRRNRFASEQAADLAPENLRSLRAIARLSARELVERLRRRGWAINEDSIYHWEDGSRRPPKAIIGALAGALGARSADLLRDRATQGARRG